MPTARATSPDGYSECGYTKAISDTCTSFEKTMNKCTLIAVDSLYPILKWYKKILRLKSPNSLRTSRLSLKLTDDLINNRKRKRMYK